jgi:hypothetical protein
MDDDSVSIGSSQHGERYALTSHLDSISNQNTQSGIPYSLYVDPTVCSSNHYVSVASTIDPDCVTKCNRCGKQPANKNFLTEWLLDSRASDHFTKDLDDCVEYEQGHFGTVRTAEAGKILSITAHGTVIFEHEVTDNLTGKVTLNTLTISPVFYVAGMGGRILSTNRFLKNGGTVIGHSKFTTLCDPKGYPILTAVNNSECCGYNLHFVFTCIVKHHGLMNQSVQEPSYEIWHNRFSHASDKALKNVLNASKTLIKIDFPRKKTTCPGCALGKQHQKSFPENPECASETGELIHLDLLKFPIQSYHKYKWVITFLDDYSSIATTALL